MRVFIPLVFLAQPVLADGHFEAFDAMSATMAEIEADFGDGADTLRCAALFRSLSELTPTASVSTLLRDNAQKMLNFSGSILAGRDPAPADISAAISPLANRAMTAFGTYFQARPEAATNLLRDARLFDPERNFCAGLVRLYDQRRG